MSIAGNHLHDANFRLRILLIIFFGISMLGVILYWNTQNLASQEYVEFPVGTGISAVKERSETPTNKPNRVRKDLKDNEDLLK